MRPYRKFHVKRSSLNVPTIVIAWVLAAFLTGSVLGAAERTDVAAIADDTAKAIADDLRGAAYYKDPKVLAGFLEGRFKELLQRMEAAPGNDVRIYQIQLPTGTSGEDFERFMARDVIPSLNTGPTRVGQATSSRLFKSREPNQYAWFVYGNAIMDRGPEGNLVERIRAFGTRIDEAGTYSALTR